MSDEIREVKLYPDVIYATEKIGSNGIHCLDYQNYADNVKYIRADLVNSTIKSRDDEISELVEALKVVIESVEILNKTPKNPEAMMKAWSRVFDSIDTANIVVDRYTKTPCPECGGAGILSTPEASYDEHPDDCICDCGACNGRGYKWEKKP